MLIVKSLGRWDLVSGVVLLLLKWLFHCFTGMSVWKFCAECVCVYTKYVWEEGIRQALSVLVCVLINSAGSNESLMFCLPSLMKHRWWGPVLCMHVSLCVAALCMQIKTPKQEGIVWECICCCFFLIMWICESGRKGANDKYYFSEFVFGYVWSNLLS